MTSALPTSSYAVLGLLSMAPMSGYELAQAADRSIANFYPISKTQTYAELDRLEKLGHVTARDVAQEKLPDKRVFELSAAGEAALDAWLTVPGLERDTYRRPTLLKVFFGHRIPREHLRELIDEYRRAAAEEIEHLTAVTALLESVPAASHTRLAALYGLRLAEAVVAWADEVRPQLPDVDPLEMRPRRTAAPTTMRLFRAVPRRPRRPGR
ncbi:MAG: PadR family transcriptional regulator [Candidatus Dormibacteria bacterium]